MFNVTIEHKYNKSLRVLEGVSLKGIGNAHNINWKYWVVKYVEYIG